MESGTIPPNWEYLVKDLSEMATSEYFNLADTWFNGPPGSVRENNQISDHFAVVTNHHKRQNTNTTGYSPSKPNPVLSSEGDSSTPYQEEQFSEPAVNLFIMPS